MKEYRNVWLFLLALACIGALFIVRVRHVQYNIVENDTDVNVQVIHDSHTDNYEVHWHAQLLIDIDGDLVSIPHNIGEATSSLAHEDGVIEEVHTHEYDDVIHLEFEQVGTDEVNVPLGSFFALWGQDFSRNSILGHSTNDGTIVFRVNNLLNDQYEQYMIQDGDVIEISYVSN